MRVLYPILVLVGCSDKGVHLEPVEPVQPANDAGTYSEYVYPPFSVTVDWTDDGLEPTDTDGDGLPESGCGDSISIDIHDPLEEENWLFGMAPTGSPDGWFGEDCYPGDSETICHEIGVVDFLGEVPDCNIASVVPGQLTFHHAGTDPLMTYYVEDTLGICFIWGHSPEYYDGLGCSEMI